MPRYEYKCARGHLTELSRSVAERDAPVECEQCPREMVVAGAYAKPLAQRIVSLTSPNFPGADRWR